MFIDENFKVFGLISILLTWAAIGYILCTIERDTARSISHHAAIKRKNYIIFCSLMSASLIMMYLFMTKWFIPTFQLPLLFSFVVTLAICLEFIATFVPLTAGWKFMVHHITSNGAAVLIPILLVILALSSVISTISFYITSMAVSLVFLLLGLFFFVKKLRSHYLIYQSLYVLVFHAALIAATYF